MPFRIRRVEGELTLASADEVVRAYRAQMFRDTDEVLPEGSETWILAKEFPGIKAGILVRTRDGELKFSTLYDVDKAWRVGLVEPDDEVIEDGGLKVTLAKNHANLTAPEAPKVFFPATHPFRIGLAIALLLGGAIAAAKSKHVLAGALWLMAVFLLSSLTRLAFTRRRGVPPAR